MINGAKLYITNGTQADWLCLLARTSDDPGYHGMSLIVVPTDVPGVAVSRKLEKLGMWSSDTAELSFTDVRVPVANTIGDIGRGFQRQMVQFQAERLMTFYKQVGSSGSRWTAQGAPARAPAFGGRCWPTNTCSSCLPSCRPATTCSSSTPAPPPTLCSRGEDATRFATIGKLLGSRTRARGGRHPVQFHGGIGYMDENSTSRYFRERASTPSAPGRQGHAAHFARMDGYSAE